MIHHWESTIPSGQHQSDVGIGPHPHIGFSPVTFIFKGEVHHQDSLGNSAIVKAGGTQWMFSGKGITHSERPSKKMAEEGGEQEIIQFWVNAPAKNKKDIPFYKPISEEDTPTITHEKVSIQVVCGEYEGIKGSVEYYSDLLLLRPTLEEGGTITLKTPKQHNTLLYLLDGELEVNGKLIKKKDLAVFDHDGEDIILKANANTRTILLSGEPINEPIATHGPFVMNTQRELMQAFDDYQNGAFGNLVEEFD